MRTLHIIKRGKRYQFICRIPSDIIHLFPHPIIYKSLKTSDEKIAVLLAISLEHHTQKLFFQIRTGMLNDNIVKGLIAQYLNEHLQFIESDVNGTVPPPPETENRKDKLRLQKIHDRKIFTLNLLDSVRTKIGMGRENYESAEKWTEDIDGRLTEARKSLVLRKTDSEELWAKIYRRIMHYNNRVKKKKDKISLSDEEKIQLYREFQKAEIKVLEVQKAASVGDLTPYENLKKTVEADVRDYSNRNILFSNVIDDYKVYYEKSKPNVKIGTIDDMKSECEMLLDIIGDISIKNVNNIRTITKLKDILGKYPRNKKQIYGDKSIHDILKTNHSYVTISKKTANEPIKRLKNIIEYAIKAELVLTSNKASNELFKVDRSGKPRKSYDLEDVKKLVDALCTKPLWVNKPQRDDRFWVILIALLHGFRLGNIVNLTKKHITLDENNWYCFDLRMFEEEGLLKTENASMLVPIHGVLLLLGFMTWVEKQKTVKLFSDTTHTFSAWYNRKDKNVRGIPSGFEPRYITDDPEKCLHSSRHYFSNELRRAGVDHKAIKEMMGHARSTSDVTSTFYLDRTETSMMKDAHDKMKLVGIDLNRLEARAIELFGLD